LCYLSVCYSYVSTPYTVLAFAVEKLVYVIIYIRFLKNGGVKKISEIASQDPLAALFFSSFGIGDGLSMIFFLVVFFITAA